jgi:hypothetical protein
MSLRVSFPQLYAIEDKGVTIGRSKHLNEMMSYHRVMI